MFIKSFVFSTLAVASIVHAQNVRECRDDVKLETSEDITTIAGCDTISGNLVIGEDLGAVELQNLKGITGDLVAENNEKLVSLSFPRLESIGGRFALNELIVLNNLNCPELGTVGSIDWIKLPELRSLSFKKTITEAGSVRITDTRLESLVGIDLRTVRNFRINSNGKLKSININLRTVEELIALESNSKALEISLPELIWAANLSARDAGSISLPKLTHINGTMSYDTNSFTKVECKQLTLVGGALTFIGNTKLTQLDFPKLKEIGGAFKLANNTILTDVTNFPSLNLIGGSIDFSGNLENVTFPAMEDVQGGFHLQTTREFDCTAFNEAHSEGIIKGDDYECEGKLAHPETKDGESGTDGSNSGGSDGGEESDDSGAGRLVVGSLPALAVAIAMLVAF